MRGKKGLRSDGRAGLPAPSFAAGRPGAGKPGALLPVSHGATCWGPCERQLGPLGKAARASGEPSCTGLPPAREALRRPRWTVRPVVGATPQRRPPGRCPCRCAPRGPPTVSGAASWLCRRRTAGGGPDARSDPAAVSPGRAWGPLWRAFCDPSNMPCDAASQSQPARPRGATHKDIPWDGATLRQPGHPWAHRRTEAALTPRDGKALAPRGWQTDVKTSGGKSRRHPHVATRVVIAHAETERCASRGHWEALRRSEKQTRTGRFRESRGLCFNQYATILYFYYSGFSNKWQKECRKSQTPKDKHHVPLTWAA